MLEPFFVERRKTQQHPTTLKESRKSRGSRKEKSLFTAPRGGRTGTNESEGNSARIKGTILPDFYVGQVTARTFVMKNRKKAVRETEAAAEKRSEPSGPSGLKKGTNLTGTKVGVLDT